MMKINPTILVIMAALLLIAYFVYMRISSSSAAPLNTSTSISVSTTIRYYMTPPSQKIEKYILLQTSPFYMSPSMPGTFSNGYVRGALFIYHYSNSNLVLRFLIYSNKTYASDAYRFITNYTFNTTTLPLAPLPTNFAGVEVIQSNTIIYSVSVLHNNTVITATVSKPVSENYENSYIIGLLVNASELLFNQSEAP